MKKKIAIMDTTLRDGEQAPRNAMTPDQKLQMAITLAELGVDYIETGFPASSHSDFEATRLISKALSNTTGIVTFSRSLENDIKTSFEAAGLHENHTLLLATSGSDIHLKKKRNITHQQAIDEVCQSIKFVRENSDCRISLGIEDATRANIDFLSKMISATVSIGANNIIVADTTGCATPLEFGKLIKFIRSQAGEEISISTHCHNDLGLALANTLAGIESGADEAQVTLGGIGERAGNASLEMVASALHFKSDEYRAYTNIHLDKIYPAWQLLCQTINLPVSRNQPILGDYVFSTAAGMHQQGMLADPDTYEFVKPDVFGRQRNLFISRHSGKSIINYIFEKNKLEYNPILVSEIYKKYIDTADDNGVMTVKDLEKKIYENYK